VTTHHKLKLGFLGWLVAFPVIACGPALAGSDDLLGFLFGGFAGLVLGSVFFVPWIVGVGLLYLLMRLTEDRRPPPAPGR
jgi:hypothetical protein